MTQTTAVTADPLAAAQKALASAVASCRSEKATGSVTVEVYVKDGTPNGTPKLIVSKAVKG